MPSYAELEDYRIKHNEEWRRYWFAVNRLYYSTGHLEIQAAVDQTPIMLIDRSVTFAALIGLGFGEPAIRAKVIAEMVAQRLEGTT